MAEFHRVASVQELADGEMMQVMVNGTEVLLARIGDEYFAMDDLCTHAYAMLHFGILHPDTCEVECPLHESYFDLRTGVPTEPADEPEPIYEVKIEGDDILVAM